MSVRDVVVLGCASQVPTRGRNHNGYLVRWDGVGLLFDPGEGTQRQMTMYGVSTACIEHICITHFHGDHCLGLPGVVQRLSLDEHGRETPCHFHASGQPYYERLRHASIFKDRSGVTAAPFSTPGPIATWGSTCLSTAPLDHTVTTWGYRLEESDHWRIDATLAKERGLTGPILGELKREGSVSSATGVVRIEDVAHRIKGQSIAFVMDTRPCEGALSLAQDVDLLICESTYLSTHQTEAHERGHMTATDAAHLARKAGARHLLLSHFSQRHPRLEAFAEEARPHFPHVTCAHDGLHLDIRALRP